MAVLSLEMSLFNLFHFILIMAFYGGCTIEFNTLRNIRRREWIRKRRRKEEEKEESGENVREYKSFFFMIAMTNENLGLKSTESQYERSHRILLINKYSL